MAMLTNRCGLRQILHAVAGGGLGSMNMMVSFTSLTYINTETAIVRVVPTPFIMSIVVLVKEELGGEFSSYYEVKASV